MECREVDPAIDLTADSPTADDDLLLNDLFCDDLPVIDLTGESPPRSPLNSAVARSHVFADRWKMPVSIAWKNDQLAGLKKEIGATTSKTSKADVLAAISSTVEHYDAVVQSCADGMLVVIGLDVGTVALGWSVVVAHVNDDPTKIQVSSTTSTLSPPLLLAHGVMPVYNSETSTKALRLNATRSALDEINRNIPAMYLCHNMC
ncbi:hypothetical protein DFJ73DRAFT_968951, partial [Zopfochytrium polystomum]